MGPMRALITLLNKKMIIGFNVMMKSFLDNNSWFMSPLWSQSHCVKILNLDLSEGDMAGIQRTFPKIDIRFENINYEAYKKINFKNTAERLRPTYYKLDMFDQPFFDRVVFIDSDTVIAGDVAELFLSNFQGIAAVYGYSEKEDLLRKDINSGGVVVTDQYLGENVYKSLIKIAEQGFSMPDQKTINVYFRNVMQHLPKIYNIEKRMEHTKRFKEEVKNARIIHYVAGKPWESDDPEKGKYPEMEKIWRKYYGKNIN